MLNKTPTVILGLCLIYTCGFGSALTGDDDSGEEKLAPYFVEVDWNNGVYPCGGVILESNVILTIGFCYGPNVTVTTNVHKSEGAKKQAQRVKVGDICSPNTYRDDLRLSNDAYAILMLEQKLTFNKFVQAASLTSESFKGADTATLVRYGVKRDLRFENIKQNECPRNRAQKGFVCFKDEESETARSGEYGNPIVIKRGNKMQLAALFYTSVPDGGGNIIAFDLWDLKDKVNDLIGRCKSRTSRRRKKESKASRSKGIAHKQRRNRQPTYLS